MFFLKKKINKIISKYHYPQYVWGREIVDYLSKSGLKVKKIIDAPCGNGEVSYYLSKIKDCTVYGYDISTECISNAKNNFNIKNIIFEQKDIFDVLENQKEIDVFCLINSLFLLNNQELLLKKIRIKLSNDGVLLLVIPNIESVNYKNFIDAANNRKLNNMELCLDELVKYLVEKGYKVIHCKGMNFVNQYGRKEIKYMFIFSHLYLIVLNYMYRYKKERMPSYYLIVCKKNKDEIFINNI